MPRQGAGCKTEPSSDNGGGAKVTVAGLAAARRLPVAFLESLGLCDVDGGGVSIPYFDAAGNHLFNRTRDVPGRPRFDQPKGVPLQVYGAERLGRAREASCLFLTEGESDGWCLWHHGIPALGIPGNPSPKVLKAEHVEGVEQVYVVVENDQGGGTFLEAVPKRLRALGYRDAVYSLHLPG